MNLCPGAILLLSAPIQFSAPYQVLTTLGDPSGSLRATIRVVGQNQTNAIYAACDRCSNIQIRNIQVDGNRPGLGVLYDPPPSALIEMGGNTAGQVMNDVHGFGKLLPCSILSL